jgi:hypothetical protein
MAITGTVRSRFTKISPEIEPGILFGRRGPWMGLGPDKEGGILEGG